MNKVFKIALLIALVCVIVPLCVWGVSRVMLKNAETTFVSGSVEEINWSAQQTYDPLDESLYHTFDVPKGTPFRVLALTDIHYRNGGWYGTWALNYQNDKTDSDIRKLVQEADPDLIIVCGDIETGTLNDKNYAHFVALMDDIGVLRGRSFSETTMRNTERIKQRLPAVLCSLRVQFSARAPQIWALCSPNVWIRRFMTRLLIRMPAGSATP